MWNITHILRRKPVRNACQSRQWRCRAPLATGRWSNVVARTPRHITPGSRSALRRNACHRSLGKVASMKGGGKPFAALTVGSRAFVNPKTLDVT
jgi:hypothetical protein